MIIKDTPNGLEKSVMLERVEMVLLLMILRGVPVDEAWILVDKLLAKADA